MFAVILTLQHPIRISGLSDICGLHPGVSDSGWEERSEWCVRREGHESKWLLGPSAVSLLYHLTVCMSYEHLSLTHISTYNRRLMLPVGCCVMLETITQHTRIKLHFWSQKKLKLWMVCVFSQRGDANCGQSNYAWNTSDWKSGIIRCL